MPGRIDLRKIGENGRKKGLDQNSILNGKLKQIHSLSHLPKLFDPNPEGHRIPAFAEPKFVDHRFGQMASTPFRKNCTPMEK